MAARACVRARERACVNCARARAQADFEWLYGPRLPTGAAPALAAAVAGAELRSTDQMFISSLLLHRLRTGSRCSLQSAPTARTQLYVVPLIAPTQRRPRPEEMNVNFNFMPPALLEQTRAVCRAIVLEDWRARLAHLSEATAPMHLFIVPGMTSLIGGCAQDDESWLLELGTGVNARLLPNFIWLSINSDAAVVLCSPGEWLPRDQPPPELDIFGFPRTVVHAAWASLKQCQLPWMRTVRRVNLPLASSVHVGHAAERDPPWRHRHARPVLMSFSGSLEGKPLAQEIRRFVKEACTGSAAYNCSYVGPNFVNGKRDWLIDAFEAKVTSVFCIEPPGCAKADAMQRAPCSAHHAAWSNVQPTRRGRRSDRLPTGTTMCASR
jgi:hypothetical protein